jgi:ribosomal protein L31E
MAASWDRYLRSIGKPQWYGTQFSIVDDKYYLMEADLSRVTDKERKAVGTRMIAEIKEFLKKQNKTEDATLDPPPAQQNAWNPGMKVPKMPSTAPGKQP